MNIPAEDLHLYRVLTPDEADHVLEQLDTLDRLTAPARTGSAYNAPHGPGWRTQADAGTVQVERDKRGRVMLCVRRGSAVASVRLTEEQAADVAGAVVRAMGVL